jgi:hypothetical protein
LRERDKEYRRRQVQPLLILAQQTFQLTRPKVYVKVNEDEWASWNGGGWPRQVPAEALFDPLATVSATYGVAFQTQFRDANNVWSSQPAVFVIDEGGVLRHVASQPGQDIREEGIFPIVDDLREQRQLIAALAAKEDLRGEAARIALASVGPRTKTAIPALAEALKDETGRCGRALLLPCTGSPRRPGPRSPLSPERFRIGTAAFAASAAWRSRGLVRAPGRPCRH